MQCNLLLALCGASLTFLSLTPEGVKECCMGYYNRAAKERRCVYLLNTSFKFGKGPSRLIKPTERVERLLLREMQNRGNDRVFI